MMKKYIACIPDLQIQTYENSNILFVRRSSKPIVDKYYINEQAVSIIQLLDGTKTLDEIIKILSKKYNDNFSNVEEIVKCFLTEIKNKFKI